MQHKRILVVDDEAVIAEELCEFLESFDYPCRSAFSADEALQVVNEDTDITLIMTDMRMPGRSGAELIRELQSMGDRSFQYVMISGHLDADQDLADIKVEDVTLMRKPINIEEMVDYLENLHFID